MKARTKAFAVRITSWLLLFLEVLASQLWGVKSYDPVIFGAAAAVLAACALFAGYVPARRAASIDPMRALRRESSIDSTGSSTARDFQPARKAHPAFRPEHT